MRFAAAPEYHVFPTLERPLKPYEAVVRAARDDAPAGRARSRPHASSPTSSRWRPRSRRELEGVPVATLVPHLDPRGAPGLAAVLDRRAAAADPRRAAAVASDEPARRDAASSAAGASSTRPARGSGCRRSATCTAGSRARWRSSRRSRSSSTRARGRPATHVVGPLLWEPPAGDVALPPGDGPLVLVAPSTSQDPGQRLLRAALEGLARPAGAGAREHEPPRARRAGRRARRTRGSSTGSSYARTMPRCDVVVCHGGHGTLARALAAGCVVVVVPGRRAT